jgi:hypothetical protein
MPSSEVNYSSSNDMRCEQKAVPGTCRISYEVPELRNLLEILRVAYRC